MASEGILSVFRVGPGGHRRFSRSQIQQHVSGDVEESDTRKVIIYSRVSTHKQASLSKESASDLIRQKERLEEWARTNHSHLPIIHFSDIGSGMSFLRPSLGQMIRAILAHELDGSILVVSYRDRLARFGYDLLELICNLHCIEIISVNQQEESDAEMLAADLSAIFHCFSCKLYGSRNKRTKTLPIEAVQRASELHSQGIGLTEITKTLDKENFRLEDGAKITANQIYTKVIKKKDLLPCGPNPFQQFRGQFIRTAPTTKAVKVLDLFNLYSKWAQENNFPAVSKVKLSQGLKLKGVTATVNDESVTVYKGVSVRGLPSFTFKEPAQKSPQDLLLDFTNTIYACTNSVQQVYANYRKYCKRNGQRALSKVAVLMVLRNMGFKELIQDKKRYVMGPAVA